jgi:hypothetical protein
MSTYYVTLKHEESGSIKLLWSFISGQLVGQSLSKAQVVNLIALGHIFYTQPKQGQGAKINVVHGKTEKYLRTDANSTEKDNLDELQDY